MTFYALRTTHYVNGMHIKRFRMIVLAVIGLLLFFFGWTLWQFPVYARELPQRILPNGRFYHTIQDQRLADKIGKISLLPCCDEADVRREIRSVEQIFFCQHTLCLSGDGGGGINDGYGRIHTSQPDQSSCTSVRFNDPYLLSLCEAYAGEQMRITRLRKRPFGFAPNRQATLAHASCESSPLVRFFA